MGDLNPLTRAMPCHRPHRGATHLSNIQLLESEVIQPIICLSIYSKMPFSISKER